MTSSRGFDTPLDPASVLGLMSEVAHLTIRQGTIIGGSAAVGEELGVSADVFKGRQLRDLGLPRTDVSFDLFFSEAAPLDLDLGAEYDEQAVRLRFLGSIGDVGYVEIRSLTEQPFARDDLTSLPERAATIGYLRRCLQDATEFSETAVLFCDIDNFKNVNDRLGHEAGDEMLTEVARRLRAAVRGADVVGRYGGDEFLVVTAGLPDASVVSDLAARIFEAVNGPAVCAGVRVPISLSMGVAVSDPSDRSATSLVKAADLAMYEAKRNGRGRLEFFSQDLTDRAANRNRNHALLVDAVENDELRIHFQRVVSTDPRSSTSSGVEALARWEHPTDGLVMPDAFIGVAEETGYITTLGTELIRLAVRDFVNWPGDERPEFLAVNMSPQQMAAENVSAEILAVLAAYELHPERLIVELTEGAFAEGQAVLDNLSAFRARGVRVYLDDFGTGYSSLSYLRRFPVDGIKIDQSFLHPTIDHGLVRIIVEIANTMDIVTVAEGIETRESFDEVAELGVAFAQGYLIDRPAPAGNFDPWSIESGSTDGRSMKAEPVG